MIRSLAELESVIKRAAEYAAPLSVCGGRHAMGGQQFLEGRALLDTTRLNRVLRFDPDRGTIEVEAGIQWPELLGWLLVRQNDPERTWTFAQKQTGANRFSLGGALGSNIHSRGLAMKPLIADSESFSLADGAGRLRQCSRIENADLFRLAIGGYGLFGVVYSVTLRLVPRRKLQRSFPNSCGSNESLIRRRFSRVIGIDTIANRIERSAEPGCIKSARELGNGESESEVENRTLGR